MSRNLVKEQEIAQLVQDLSQNDRLLSALQLYWNRCRMLFEKCILLNRSLGTIVQILLPFFLALFFKKSIIDNIHISSSNGSTTPTFPETNLDIFLSRTDNYYSLSKGVNEIEVEDFIDYTNKMFQQCSLYQKLNFTKVDSYTNIDWNVFFQSSSMGLTFNEQFSKLKLDYDITEPNLARKTLKEPWSMIQNYDSNDFYSSPEANMHFLITTSFVNWSNNVTVNKIICPSYKIQPLQLDSFYFLTSGISKALNFTPELLEAYSYAFIFMLLVPALAFQSMVSKEGHSTSKEFLRLMGADNLQIHSVNVVFFFVFTSVSFSLPIAYFYFSDALHNLPMWPVFAMIHHLIIGTGVFVCLTSLLLKKPAISRVYLTSVIMMTLFSSLSKGKVWFYIFVFPTPFYQFHVNWQIGVNAFYQNVTIPNDPWQKEPDFYNMNWLQSFCLSWSLIIVSFLLLLYLSECWPFQPGNIRPFHFILSKSFWWPTGKTDQPIGSVPYKNPSRFEQTQAEPIISIRNLQKSFRDGAPYFRQRTAIPNLNFDIFGNQITALLGFNGAGKTTLIDMITGFKMIDSGRIVVSGKDIHTQTASVRNLLGLCPQTNLFYVRLSVGQNLRLAAVMKGIPFEQADQKAELAASLVNLKDQINKKASDLSGGMKRRLCLACAIIGNWDVLLLDEPTSGLDPETRRDVWDLLLQIRKIRTIILTTHFMEEADVLADRIAIMAKGEIVCAGSASFLKRAYQTGYVLNLQLRADCDRQTLFKHIQYYLVDSIIYREKTNELSIQLLGSKDMDNDSFIEAITSMFRWLESDHGREFVQTFAMINTSLEDVFLKVGEETEATELAKNALNGVSDEAFDDKRLDEETGSTDSILLFDSPQGWSKIWPQTKALLYKRLCYMLKQFLSTIRMFTFPFILGILLSQLANTAYEKYIAVIPTQTAVLQFNETYKNVKAVFGSDAEPKNIELMNNFAKLTKDNFDVEPVILDPGLDVNQYVQDQANQNLNPKEFAFALSFSESEIKMWPNIIYRFSVPSLYSLFFSNLLSSETNLFHGIRTALNLSPYPAEEYLYIIFILSALGSICQVFLLFLIPTMVQILKNPQVELKRNSIFMQRISGISKNQYWLVNFCFDYFLLLLMLTIMFVFLSFSDKGGIYKISHHTADLTTIYFSCMGLIGVSYIYVRLLYNKTYMNSLYYFYFIGGGLIPFITVAFFEAIHLPVHSSTRIILFAFFPQATFFYAFARIIVSNGLQICQNSSGSECKFITLITPRLSNENDYSTLYIAVISAAVILALNSIDYITDPLNRAASRFISMLFTSRLYNEESGLRHHAKLDVEILKEQLEVEEMVENKSFADHMVVISKLSKRFGSKVAVDNISFKIKDKECFGLLGLNGAGKSTTFSMLTGATQRTSGDIFLKGELIKASKMSKAYEILSFCPQSEQIFEGLTVSQTLFFYLMAQNAPPAHITHILKRIVALTNLQDYVNSTADSLSGGNKRKLTLAVALIGAPPLILLDEPTTGVDPVARRKIWKCLNLFRKIGRCSYLLTSHSMDECEFLCDRIAIMANGKLRCLGTPFELKQNYAQGYQITLKVEYQFIHDSEYVETVKSRLSSCFPEKILFREMHMNTMDFVLNDSNVLWSELFARLHELSKELKLPDFVIKTTSLEDVFLGFVD